MRRTIYVSCLFIITLLVGCGDNLSVQTRGFRQDLQGPVKRVAVVDFAGEAGQAVADMLTMHLNRQGFQVVERQYLNDLLRGGVQPIKENQTDATLTERLSKVGKLLNADAIITGDLIKLQYTLFERADKDRLKYEGATCELSARAFDVRTREVFWVTIINVTASAKDGKQLGPLDHISEACAELAESFATSKYQHGSHVYTGKEIAAHRESRGKSGH